METELGATVAFTHCPFRDLAETHPELVCSLHRGLVEGFVAEVSGGPGRAGSAASSTVIRARSTWPSRSPLGQRAADPAGNDEVPSVVGKVAGTVAWPAPATGRVGSLPTVTIPGGTHVITLTDKARSR